MAHRDFRCSLILRRRRIEYQVLFTPFSHREGRGFRIQCNDIAYTNIISSGKVWRKPIRRDPGLLYAITKNMEFGEPYIAVG